MIVADNMMCVHVEVRSSFLALEANSCMTEFLANKIQAAPQLRTKGVRLVTISSTVWSVHGLESR